MEQFAPKFQEEYAAKIPAMTLLAGLGWSFLSPQEALALRDGKQDRVVLREVLRDVLSKRTFQYAGKSYSLSENSIDNIISHLCSPALNEGLRHANEAIYNHLM